VQLHGRDGGTGIARGDGEAPGGSTGADVEHPESGLREQLGCLLGAWAEESPDLWDETRIEGLRPGDRRRIRWRRPATQYRLESGPWPQQLDELEEARMRGLKTTVAAELEEVKTGER
jgi:hypothetical protein